MQLPIHLANAAANHEAGPAIARQRLEEPMRIGGQRQKVYWDLSYPDHCTDVSRNAGWLDAELPIVDCADGDDGPQASAAAGGGEPGGIRTHDPRLKRPLLYH